MRQTRHFLIGFKVHSVWWNPYLTLIKLPEIGDLTVLHLSLSILYTFYFSQYSSDDIEITWVSKHGQIMEYVPKALLDVLWRAIKAQNSQYVVTEYNNKHNVSVQWRKKDHEASTTQEKLQATKECWEEHTKWLFNTRCSSLKTFIQIYFSVWCIHREILFNYRYELWRQMCESGDHHGKWGKPICKIKSRQTYFFFMYWV